jgi:hypothetical protein
MNISVINKMLTCVESHNCYLNLLTFHVLFHTGYMIRHCMFPEISDVCFKSILPSVLHVHLGINYPEYNATSW